MTIAKQPLLQIISIATILGSISFTAHAQTHPAAIVSGGATINLTGGDPIPYVNSGAFGYAIAAMGAGSTVTVTGAGSSGMSGWRSLGCIWGNESKSVKSDDYYRIAIAVRACI